MVNNNIEKFVFNHYKDFSRKTYLGWAVAIAIASFFLKNVYTSSLAKILTISSACIYIGYMLFLFSFDDKRGKPIHHFIAEGMTMSLVSIHLNYNSYIILFDGSKFMFLSFLLTLLICSAFFVWIAKKNIENTSNNKKNSNAWALVGAIFGFTFGKVFLSSLNYNVMEKIVGIIMLIGSLLFSMCSVCFLRAYYIFRFQLTNK